MFLKVLLIAAILVVYVEAEDDYKSYPKYQFKYGVEDKHTGDIKSQEEVRDGHLVKGSYVVKDPHGSISVQYVRD